MLAQIDKIGVVMGTHEFLEYPVILVSKADRHVQMSFPCSKFYRPKNVYQHVQYTKIKCLELRCFSSIHHTAISICEYDQAYFHTKVLVFFVFQMLYVSTFIYFNVFIWK